MWGSAGVKPSSHCKLVNPWRPYMRRQIWRSETNIRTHRSAHAHTYVLDDPSLAATRKCAAPQTRARAPPPPPPPPQFPSQFLVTPPLLVPPPLSTSLITHLAPTPHHPPTPTLRYFEKQLTLHPSLTTRMGTEATTESLAAEGYTHIVVTTGE